MRILLIEDDLEICRAVKTQLDLEEYFTDICDNGEDAMFYIKKQSYDVIVLDRMLPKIDGLTILRSMRKENIQTPVILATAMGAVDDRIDGLDSGADDYIVKPYEIKELTARIRALVRRPVRIENIDRICFEDLALNVKERELVCGNVKVRLSKRETLLMEFLLKNANKTLSREAIFVHVWGASSEVEDGNLDNYIHFIRKRLKTLNSTVELKTIHGSGYQLIR